MVWIVVLMLLVICAIIGFMVALGMRRQPETPDQNIDVCLKEDNLITHDDCRSYFIN